MDLEKLGKMVDDALANETKESLTKWLNEHRKNNEENVNQLIKPVTITCRLCGSTTDTRVKIENDGHKHCKNCGNYWL